MRAIKGEVIEFDSGSGVVTHVSNKFITVATVYPPTAQLFDKLFGRGYKCVAGPAGPSPGPKGLSFFTTFKER